MKARSAGSSARNFKVFGFQVKGSNSPEISISNGFSRCCHSDKLKRYFSKSGKSSTLGGSGP